MKSCENVDSYKCFIDNSQKLHESEMHLKLYLLMFQKIIKKSISISLQTYEQNGGGRTFLKCAGCSQKQIIMICVKKHRFLCEGRNLGLKPPTLFGEQKTRAKERGDRGGGGSPPRSARWRLPRKTDAREAASPFQAAKSSSPTARFKKMLPAQDADAGDSRKCV